MKSQFKRIQKITVGIIVLVLSPVFFLFQNFNYDAIQNVYPDSGYISATESTNYAENFAEKGPQYSASAMVDQFDGNKTKVWFCDYQKLETPTPHDWDQISYRDSGNGWQKALAFKNVQGTDGYTPTSGKFNCDPSVIRGNWSLQFRDQYGNMVSDTFSYVAYYTTEGLNDGAGVGSAGRIQAAFSKDGMTWQKCTNCGPNQNGDLINYTGTVSDPAEYGAGQQVAWSANGGSGVNIIYSNVTQQGYRYFYRYAANGIDFGPETLINRSGIQNIDPDSGLYPAIGFAKGTDGYYYLAKTSQQYRYISVYKIPYAGLTDPNYQWTKVFDTSNARYEFQNEPAFETDAYGQLTSFPTIKIYAACSQTPFVPSSETYNPAQTWDICWYKKVVTAAAPQTTNRLPQGNFEDAYSLQLKGWVADLDSPNQNVRLHIYRNGTYDAGGTFMGEFLTHADRPDVRSALQIPGNHGFTIPMSSMYVGQAFHIYAIDLNDGTKNTYLGYKTLMSSVPGSTSSSTPTTLAACPPNAVGMAAGQSLNCSCSSINQSSIWGSNPYSYDSSICTAARHAGIISSTGGNLKVQRIGMASSFASSTMNGITSYAYSAYEAMSISVATATSSTPTTYASCTFNGQTVNHGASVTGYLASSVTSPSVCSAQARTCNNGSLSGSYGFNSCSVIAAQTYASCTFNGQTIAHGNPVTAYAASSVVSPSTCLYQSRVCSNGVLSGSYSFAGCSVTAPPATTSGGGTMACPSNAMGIGVSQSLTCYCSAASTSVSSAIWGSNPYTYDSSPCKSAVHAGLISSSGGNIKINRISIQPNFSSTYSNGILSSAWGSYYDAMQIQSVAGGSTSTSTPPPVSVTPPPTTSSCNVNSNSCGGYGEAMWGGACDKGSYVGWRVTNGQWVTCN